MKAHVPEVYQEVSMFVDLLPLLEHCPAYPYQNFALNICVCTKAHRDSTDKSWCTAFTIQDCKGGQICLHESGLVFDSNHGDMLVFRSEKDTQFNLHFEGIRTSLVLHTDAGGANWVDAYNRWDKHVH